MLILYTRDDCHLCDQAIALLATAGVPDFESVWIDGDDALEMRYGDRVRAVAMRLVGQDGKWRVSALQH